MTDSLEQTQNNVVAAQHHGREIQQDALCRIEELVTKARALNYMTYGNNGDNLRHADAWIQDGINWLLADLLKGIEKELETAVSA